MAGAIAFRPLAEADFPLLHEWLRRPHVAAWWQPTPTLAELRDDYLEALAPPGMRPLDWPAGTIPYMAYEDDRPIGFIQVYRVMAHQADGWWPDETDADALGIDQFLADAERLGQGLGTRMIRSFTAALFADERVSTIQTDPDPGNARAIACYRKVGFRDVGVVATPDGPALLMRMGRWAS